MAFDMQAFSHDSLEPSLNALVSSRS